MASILLNQSIIFFMSTEDTTIIGTQEGTQLHTLPSFLNLTAMLSLSEKVLLSQTAFSFSDLTLSFILFSFLFSSFLFFSFFHLLYNVCLNIYIYKVATMVCLHTLCNKLLI